MLTCMDQSGCSVLELNVVDICINTLPSSICSSRMWFTFALHPRSMDTNEQLPHGWWCFVHWLFTMVLGMPCWICCWHYQPRLARCSSYAWMNEKYTEQIARGKALGKLPPHCSAWHESSWQWVKLLSPVTVARLIFAIWCDVRCSGESWKAWILTGLADHWGTDRCYLARLMTFGVVSATDTMQPTWALCTHPSEKGN